MRNFSPRTLSPRLAAVVEPAPSGVPAFGRGDLERPSPRTVRLKPVDDQGPAALGHDTFVAGSSVQGVVADLAGKCAVDVERPRQELELGHSGLPARTRDS